MIQDFAGRVRVVLVRPLQAGNVGASARAMKNMGLRDLVVVAPRTDKPERAWWMAPGAHDILQQASEVQTVEDAVEGCTLVVGTTARGRRLRWPVMHPDELAQRVLEHPGRVAILFGPEDSGLDNESLLLCHALATVPTDEAHSLNLAQAVLLIAHHIFEEARRRGYKPPLRRRQARRGTRTHPAAPANMRGLHDNPAAANLVSEAARQAVALLGRTAYLLGRNPDQVRLTLYHLLQRANPTQREVGILLGMLAKLAFVVENPDARVDQPPV